MNEARDNSSEDEVASLKGGDFLKNPLACFLMS